MKEGVTIVLPAYNRVGVIWRTLDSITAQTYSPSCVILVDNNSTDGTMHEMETWAEGQSFPVNLIQETKPGACAARNAGLAQVETEWTMFFDSDDTMMPTHVERAMSMARKHPEANMVGWDIRMHFSDGKCARKQFVTKDMAANCVLHGTMATQRYMAKTELFRKAGAWHEDVEVWNDIELGIRLLPTAKAIKVRGEATVDTYDSGNASITGVGFLAKGKEREYALRRIEATLSVDQWWIVRLRRAVLAGLYYSEGGKDEASRLLGDALSNELGRWNRMLYHIAYAMTSRRIRGAARLLRPFIKERRQ